MGTGDGEGVSGSRWLGVGPRQLQVGRAGGGESRYAEEVDAKPRCAPLPWQGDPERVGPTLLGG